MTAHRRPLRSLITTSLVSSAAVLFHSYESSVEALAPLGQNMLSHPQHGSCGRTTRMNSPAFPGGATTSSLSMSDIPRDEDSVSPASLLLDDMQEWLYRQLPPSPEDSMVMLGDVGLLLTYGMMSHILPTFLVEHTFARHGDHWQDAVQALDPDNIIISTTTQSPNWLEQADTTSDIILKAAAHQDLLPQFGPLFYSVGSASISLVTAWLVAGWIHHSFLYKHTLECDTSHVLVKTLETWTTTVLLLVAAAGITHFGVQSVMPLQEIMSASTAGSSSSMVLGWITKSDFMYILDSFTVLVAWRFMISSMFGDNSRNDESSKKKTKEDDL